MTIAFQGRYRDEVDAARDAHLWIEAEVERRGMKGKPGAEITQTENVVALWDFGMPVAIAVCLRDDLNNTVLTRWTI